MITKITKNIDSIDIECIQAHRLDGGGNELVDVRYICGVPNACNYEPDISTPDNEIQYIIDNTLCVYPNISDQCPVPGIDYDMGGGSEHYETSNYNSDFNSVILFIMFCLFHPSITTRMRKSASKMTK